jgi:hypothetical protein
LSIHSRAEMSSPADMPETTPSRKSSSEAERAAASAGEAPILNFLEPFDDALNAFPPEEQTEKCRDTRYDINSRHNSTSDAAATLRLQLAPTDYDLQLKYPTQESRYVQLPILVPRQTVQKGAYRPTFVTGVMTALSVSLAIVLLVAVVHYFEPLDQPSEVAALPELQAVPTVSGVGTYPRSPISIRGGGRAETNAGSQTKSIAPSKGATTVTPKGDALSGTSSVKNPALSSQRALPKPSSALKTENTRSAASDRIVPVTPTAPAPARVDGVGEVVSTPSTAAPPASAPTNGVASGSAAAAGQFVAPPSGPPALSATVAAPITTAAPTASRAGASDELAVRNILVRYRSAYENLNVNAAKGVWPSVDTKALGRAFAGLQSQQFNFSNCQISVDTDRANAVCGGTARFVPRVGNKSERVEFRTWNFEMRKADDQWMIAKVAVH